MRISDSNQSRKMGCDIHMYVEYRRVYPATTLVELCRRNIQDTVDRMHYDLRILPQDMIDLVKLHTIREEWITPFVEQDEDVQDGETPTLLASEIDVGRNYDLFGVLADVRNYRYRFPTVPCNEGIPNDVCPYVVECKKIWCVDHMYFELLRFKGWRFAQPSMDSSK